MSLYNIVVEAVPETCPACRAEILRSVQFKFGDTELYRYRVGDEIRWGGNGNDTGEPGLGLVVVSGYPEPCPRCGDYESDLEYEVWIRRDRIESVRPSSGRFTPTSVDQGYWVVEEGPGGGEEGA
jgi:hypothetical protein